MNINHFSVSISKLLKSARPKLIPHNLTNHDAIICKNTAKKKPGVDQRQVS